MPLVPSHVISDAFMDSLLDGALNPVLSAVRDDDTLMLGIRNRYVSIYYRGGEILKLTPGSGGYQPAFNNKYLGSGVASDRAARRGVLDVVREVVAEKAQGEVLADVLPDLKAVMDRHQKIRSGHEREFQQLVARENNRSRSAGSTEYFITDMEHASGDARFDMLGVLWDAGGRRHGDRLVPVLFEMKYGDSAFDGPAGIEAHLDDIYKRLASNERDSRTGQTFHETLRANVGAQFNQLDKLGLLQYTRSGAITSFAAVAERVQIVFVLAAYNPRSTKLRTILDRIEESMANAPHDHRAGSPVVELRFFQATFCGYSMHSSDMVDLPTLRGRLNG